MSTNTDAIPTPEHLCSIAFQSEAYDSAAVALRRWVGWTMSVYPTRDDVEPFDGTLRDVVVSDDGGEWVALLAPWEDEVEPTADTPLRHVYLYGTRFEVI